ncbi:acetyl xylan esterase AXE1 [Promicromonospora sp. AC04]|uniref:acetylxylan esterase n=1 Tax=Promicromonospora sp. AC04 TaxID=2135723 RepID=UPI000D3AD99D|nr:acetylxylan esterase [Promicromonospora sp. AC04]PUB22271.1 acetyl xylan esterase AXE1 [Promicromonospora sp. AC04]
MSEYDLPLVTVAPATPPATDEPADFDLFWSETLSAHRDIEVAPVLTAASARSRDLAAETVTFAGFQGRPVAGWLVTPVGAASTLPGLVELRPAGRDASRDLEWLAPGGFAHLVVELPGDDAGDPYNRGVFTDAVRAVQALRTLASVDPSRVAVLGTGPVAAAAVATAGLLPDLACALVEGDIPAAHQDSLVAFARRASAPLQLVQGAGTQVLLEEWGVGAALALSAMTGSVERVVECVLTTEKDLARRRTSWITRHTHLTTVFVPQIAY